MDYVSPSSEISMRVELVKDPVKGDDPEIFRLETL